MRLYVSGSALAGHGVRRSLPSGMEKRSEVEHELLQWYSTSGKRATGRTRVVKRNESRQCTQQIVHALITFVHIKKGTLCA